MPPIAALMVTLLASAMLSFTAQAQDVKPDKSTDSAKVLLEDSFETGRTTPDGWKSGAPISGVKYVYDKKLGSKGKRSLSLQKSAQRYFPIAQWYRIIPAPRAAGIDVKAMVKADGVTKAIIEVQFLNDGGKRLSKKWVGYIGAKQAGDKPVSHEWKSYGSVAEVPGNTKQVLIGLQIYGPGKVWFDDLKVTEATTSAPDTNSDSKPAPGTTSIKINGADAQYIFKAARKPGSKPAGLLIVLPGGDGSADFHPFVSRIHANSAANDVMLAQPVAKKWSATQQIVWPTSSLKVDGMKYTTEELIAAVVNDVKKKHTVDSKRISILAWSSSGSAAYATLLQEKPVATRGLIAMSVFKPDYLPPLEAAKGRGFYLLHSPQDRTCPHRMARDAEDKLSQNGGRVTLVDYPGGHGWRGDVFGNIRTGLEWLAKGN